MPEDSDNSRRSNHGFAVLVLVPVEEKFWRGACDVIVERRKTGVDFIFTVVDQSGGIVRKKDVDVRKVCQPLLHFGLLEKVIASRLVFPRTAETAECQSAKRGGRKMRVADWWPERRTRIVVAFHRKDHMTTASSCDFANGVVRQVTQGN